MKTVERHDISVLVVHFDSCAQHCSMLTEDNLKLLPTRQRDNETVPNN